jgi:hypothetical protein
MQGAPSRTQIQQHLGQARANISGQRVNASQLRNRVQTRQYTGRGVRQGVNQRHWDRRNWYNDNFWNRHGHPVYWGAVAGSAWASSNWNDVNSWLGYGTAYPYYYDSGYAYPIQDTGIYTEPQQQTPAPTNSYQQTAPTTIYQQISPTVTYQQPTTTATQADPDWLPLGVFALVEERTATANPNMFLQLAVKKDGTLAGTFYNSSLDKTASVIGLVDPNTQIARLTFADKPDSAVAETGIYNLTQNEASLRVTFPTGQTQDWLLVRLEQP